MNMHIYICTYFVLVPRMSSAYYYEVVRLQKKANIYDVVRPQKKAARHLKYYGGGTLAGKLFSTGILRCCIPTWSIPGGYQVHISYNSISRMYLVLRQSVP